MEHGGHTQQQFEEAIPELQRYLYQAVISWGFNLTDAAEIVQETLVRFYLHMEKNQWTANIDDQKAFIITIARNVAHDLGRRRQKEKLVTDENDEQLTRASDRSASESMSFADPQRRLEIEETFRSLPLDIFFHNISKEDFYLLLLHECDGMSYEDIANELGLNKDSVRYRVRRTLQTVLYRTKKFLKETHQEGIFKRNV